MPLFTIPIHEHGDPSRPGPYPHGGGGSSRSTLQETPESTLPLRETTAYLRGLPPAQQQAIVSLSRWTDSARTLNRALWKGKEPSARQASLYTSLSAAVENAPPLPAPVTVWRGLSTDRAGLLKLQPGQTVALQGFQSTSLDPSVAGNRGLIFGDRANDTPVLLQIETSQGLYIKPISIVESEKEFVLGHNWRYEVVSVGTTLVPSGDSELADRPIALVRLRHVKD